MNIDGNNDGDFLDVGDTLAWGSIPEDVADGYSELLTKYEAAFAVGFRTTCYVFRRSQASVTALLPTSSHPWNTSARPMNRTRGERVLSAGSPR